MPQPGNSPAVAERRLGTWPIFVIAVSAMTPLTVVAGALPLGYGQVEEKGLPVAYILVAAVLGIFAVGLAAMARHVPNRGAFYAYAAAGLSRPAGVGTAFVALLAYNAMQIGLYGAFGVATHNAVAIFGPEISWVVWALLGWAVIALLGRLNIDLNARILTVLVCAEVLVVLVLDAAMVTHPAGGTIAFDTLNPALIASAGGVALLVAAVAGVVGFESPLVYAAEARDPRRTVVRAMGLTLLVAAILYGGTAWVMSVAAGPDQIVVVAAAHLDDLFFFLPEPYLPTVVIDLARVFFATSLFAAMLAFHHTVARYALTVAREGVLPGALARTRNDVPVTASIAQSGLALVVLLLFAVAGWNPTTDLFFFGTVSGGLGVLLLMAVASVAVVRFFRRDAHGETTWRRAVAPWIAAVFLIIIVLLTVASFGILLDSDNLVKVWSPPLAFLLLFLLGVRWGRTLRRQRPEVYAVIGTGLPPETAAAPGDVAADDGVPVKTPPVRTASPGAASAPEKTGRDETAPEKAAPVTAASGEPAPGETAPGETAPGETAPGETAPVAATPAEPDPEKSPIKSASGTPAEGAPAEGATSEGSTSGSTASGSTPSEPTASGATSEESVPGSDVTPGTAARDPLPDPALKDGTAKKPITESTGDPAQPPAAPSSNGSRRRVPRARQAPESGATPPPAVAPPDANPPRRRPPRPRRPATPDTAEADRPEDSV